MKSNTPYLLEEGILHATVPRPTNIDSLWGAIWLTWCMICAMWCMIAALWLMHTITWGYLILK